MRCGAVWWGKEGRNGGLLSLYTGAAHPRRKALGYHSPAPRQPTNQLFNTCVGFRWMLTTLHIQYYIHHHLHFHFIFKYSVACMLCYVRDAVLQSCPVCSLLSEISSTWTCNFVSVVKGGHGGWVGVTRETPVPTPSLPQPRSPDS